MKTQTPEQDKSESTGIVMRALQDWVDAGMKDECFWEEWTECPTEINLTPQMVLDALKEIK